MRINKYIADALNISRRRADDIILERHVKVNGTVCKPGYIVDDNDVVTIDDKQLDLKKEFKYLLLNKPVGYVCSRNGQGSNTIYELLPPVFHFLKNVGRLDKESCGLLLLTNDGELHNKLTHPRYQKLKVYQAKLDKKLTTEDLNNIKAHGVMLKDGLSKFEITIDKPNLYLVKMSQGRNRQIRRTFEALGYKVTYLNRIIFGKYELNDLKPGEYKLTDKKL